MSIHDTDAASAAVQKTPNRVTVEFIESQIVSRDKLEVPGHPHMTVIAVTFRNGFVIIGKSAPADPGNYDLDLGIQFAYDDAIRQVWPMFAFELRSRMTEDAERA